MDYPYVRAWGQYMGSQPHYITAQVARARETGAPPTAIYEKWASNGAGPTGEWAVYADITNPFAKAAIDRTITGA